jgi:hypothetical protein
MMMTSSTSFASAPNPVHEWTAASPGLMAGIVVGVIALSAVAIIVTILIRHREEDGEEEQEEDHETDHELQYERHFAGIGGHDMSEASESGFSFAIPSFVTAENPQAILDFNPERSFV